MANPKPTSDDNLGFIETFKSYIKNVGGKAKFLKAPYLHGQRYRTEHESYVHTVAYACITCPLRLKYLGLPSFSGIKLSKKAAIKALVSDFSASTVQAVMTMLDGAEVVDDAGDGDELDEQARSDAESRLNSLFARLDAEVSDDGDAA